MAIRLRELRDRLGHSQDGMAVAVGMEQTAWSRWEKNPPAQLDILARIASHYGISADYLLGLVDDPAGRRDLATDELETLRLWEALDGNQRRLVLDTMKALQKATTPRIVGEEED